MSDARPTTAQWCPEPDDHCLRGDCVYGDHGPLTDDALDALIANGYGWALDDDGSEGT